LPCSKTGACLPVLKMNKKAQEVLGLSFGMIFSILLIIFFIVAAWIAIKMFWNPNECALSDQSQEGIFKSEFQGAINDAWNSEKTSRDFKISLPAKISHVCFLDMNKEPSGEFEDFYNELSLYSEGENNLYLYPPKKACTGFRALAIQHINASEITKNSNPHCIENKNNPNLRLEKGFYDSLVKVS